MALWMGVQRGGGGLQGAGTGRLRKVDSFQFRLRLSLRLWRWRWRGERASARVCGVMAAGVILGQIQHECASLTPRKDIGAAMDMYPCSSQRCGVHTSRKVFFWIWMLD